MTSVYDSFNESQRFACRVIADHARATAFSIADGILPGNEGRNYVLRKIMRRAIYHGREHLGLTEPFFYKVCDFVVENMREAYPELAPQRDFIIKMVRVEEERFGNTLTEGLTRVHENLSRPNVIEFFELLRTLSLEFNRLTLGVADKIHQMNESVNIWAEKDSVQKALRFLSQLAESQKRFEESRRKHDELKNRLKESMRPEQRSNLTVEEAKRIEENLKKLFVGLAKLYDTYGTPKDLIRVELEEKGLPFDEETFNTNFDPAIQELQKQSGIGHTQRKSEISPIYAKILDEVGKSTFRGYETTRVEAAKVIAILDGNGPIEGLAEGEQGGVVLNETPFYADAGGQVGDTGKIVSADASLTVSDTYSPVAGLIIHKVTVDKGSIKVGDVVSATVDVQERDATRRNHTATHLMHAALREVLGTHVKQAGSVVAPSYLRFDFTHYQPLTDAEVTEIEDLVNRYILENHPVNTALMAIEEAMRGGATALFGEKYGADVRVLSVGDGLFSKELCGGTHVRATGDIGSFKITSDEAVASGVRRIRAITGFDAFERFREDEKLIDRSLDALKTQRDYLPDAIEKLQEELKRARRENEELRLKIATGSIGEASEKGDEAREIAGVKVLGKIVEGLDGNGIRQLSDTLLSRLKSGVVVLGRARDGKVGIIVRVSDDLTGRVKAGNVIKEIVPIVGGRGGGRPDMAEGGGTEPEKLSEAIDASYGVIEKMLG